MPERGIAVPFNSVQSFSNDTEKVDALYECCNAFYKSKGDDASTVSCPKASLLR